MLAVSYFWLGFLGAAQLGTLNKVWHNIAVKYCTLQHHLLLFAFFQLQYACEHRHQSAAKLGVALSEGMNIFSITEFGSEIIMLALSCPAQWKYWSTQIWLKGLEHVRYWTYYRFSSPPLVLTARNVTPVSPVKCSIEHIWLRLCPPGPPGPGCKL